MTPEISALDRPLAPMIVLHVQQITQSAELLYVCKVTQWSLYSAAIYCCSFFFHLFLEGNLKDV